MHFLISLLVCFYLFFTKKSLKYYKLNLKNKKISKFNVLFIKLQLNLTVMYLSLKRLFLWVMLGIIVVACPLTFLFFI